MLLAFDIGNTETTVGLFDPRRTDVDAQVDIRDASSDPQLAMQWRLTTHAPHTADELRFKLLQLVGSARRTPEEIHAVAICSVVPTLTPVLVEACQTVFGHTPLVIDWRSPLPITLAVDEPSTVGADRVINTLAASHLYHRDAIVVDLGTATTYDCITDNGAFIGGVIQPGVQTSLDTLVRKTSLLPATILAIPERTIGTNTVACIQSGVMLGAAESIDGLIRRIKREWPTKSSPHVIATGGLSPMFDGVCHEFDIIDPALTLKGVQIAHRLITTASR